MRLLGLPMADTVMTGVHVIAVTAILTHGIQPAASVRRIFGIGERPPHLPALSPDTGALSGLHARLATVEAERADLAAERNRLAVRLDRCTEAVAGWEASAGGMGAESESLADLRDQLSVAISARGEGEADCARREAERDEARSNSAASDGLSEDERTSLTSYNKVLDADRDRLQEELTFLRETVTSQSTLHPPSLACMEQATGRRIGDSEVAGVTDVVVSGFDGVVNAACACDEDGANAWAAAEAARDAALRACGVSVALLLNLATVFACLLRARRQLRSQAEELALVHTQIASKTPSAVAATVAGIPSKQDALPPHEASEGVSSRRQSKVTGACVASSPMGREANLDLRPARAAPAVQAARACGASPAHAVPVDSGGRSHAAGAWPSAEGNGDEDMASPWGGGPSPEKDNHPDLEREHGTSRKEKHPKMEHGACDGPDSSPGNSFGSPTPRNLFASPPARAAANRMPVPTAEPASIPQHGSLTRLAAAAAVLGEARACALVTPASAEAAKVAHGRGAPAAAEAQPYLDGRKAELASTSSKPTSSRRPPLRSPLFLDEFGPFG
jgi:hypothetical protein